MQSYFLKTGVWHLQTAYCILQTADCRPQTAVVTWCLRTYIGLRPYMVIVYIKERINDQKTICAGGVTSNTTYLGRLQTADRRPQTADCRLQTTDCRLQTADCRLQTGSTRKILLTVTSSSTTFPTAQNNINLVEKILLDFLWWFTVMVLDSG